MTHTVEELITQWPYTTPNTGLVAEVLAIPELACLVHALPLADARALLAFVMFARENTRRFDGDSDPDAPLKWLANIANADPHRQQTLQMLMMAGANLADDYAEIARALYVTVRADPRSIAKRNGAVFRVVGFNPDNIPKLGGARKSATATWNGILVRELSDRVPAETAERAALITRLSALCGTNVTRQSVNRMINRRRR
jgi:hypothetical protein